jgi:thioesterase domain-containing protein
MTTDVPDASAFEDRVDKLSAQRRALLAHLQRASPPAAPTTAPVKARQAPPPIRRRDRQSPPSPPPATAETGGQFEDRLSQLAPSRQALLRALRARQSAASPLVPLQPKGSRPPLVCVHAISGSVFAYRSLVGHLDADQPIFGLEAPGFDGAAAPIEDLPALASTYGKALDDAFGDRPLTLLGWSMGGVVAYEIARQRYERTGAALPLILVDAWVPISQPIPDDSQTLRYYLRELTASTEDVDNLNGASFDDVIDELRSTGRLPADLATDVARSRFRVLQANVRALHIYTPTGPHPGPVTQIVPIDSDRTFDHWSRLPTTPAATTTHTVPGTHDTVWDPPHLPTLATAIHRSLTPPQSGGDPRGTVDRTVYRV